MLKNISNKLFKRLYHSNEKSWAIISGATGGLGESYSNILYKLNFNLIIIGRNTKKLMQTKDNILKHNRNSNLNIDIMCIDFENNGTKDIINIINSNICNKNIKILVNCVGQGGNAKNYLENYKYNAEDLTKDILNDEKFVKVNLLSHLILTKLFLRYKNNKEKCLLINISSLLGVNCSPGLSLYGSCKAFQTHFNNSLSFENEYNHDLLDIYTFTPWYIDTNMVKRIKSKFKMTSLKFVQNSLIKISIISYFKYLLNPCSKFFKMLVIKSKSSKYSSSVSFVHYLITKYYVKNRQFPSYFYKYIMKLKLIPISELRKKKKENKKSDNY